MNQYVINVKRNIKFGILSRAAQLIFPFIIRGVIVERLGIEYVGLNGLFVSVFSILNLTELGIGGALTFFLYEPIAKQDNETIRQILALYRKCYCIIGGIVLGAGIIIMPFLPFLIKDSYPSEINIYIIYLINLISIVIPYWVYAHEVSLISAHQREDILLKVNFIFCIIQSILQIGVLILFENYYVYITIIPIICIIANCIVGNIGKKRYKELYPYGEVSPQLLIVIKARIKAIFFHKVGGTIYHVIDTFVISVCIGLTAVGVYNNYYTIITSLYAFFDMIANSSRAIIGNMLCKEDKNKNYKMFEQLSVLFFVFLGWTTICLYTLIQPFITVWVGSEYLLDERTMIILVLSFFCAKINFVVELYKNALGLWTEDKYKALIMSVINVIFSCLLVRQYGIAGIVFATIVCLVFVSIPWEIYIVIKRYFNESIVKYVLKILFRIALFACSLFLSNIISEFIVKNNYMPWYVSFIIYNVVYFIIMFLAYGKQIIKTIKNIVRG